MADILDELNRKDITVFQMDIQELVRVACCIDRDYRSTKSSLDYYFPKYIQLAKLFTKKYNGISGKIEKSLEKINLRIFLKEKSLNSIYIDILSKISGLKSVGINGFDEVLVSNQKAVLNLLNDMEDELYLTYLDTDGETSTIFLRHDKKEKKIEIIYDADEIVNIYKAEFRFIAYYAINRGYKKDIDFYSKAIELGFYESVPDDTKKQWLNKFNPRFQE